MEWVKTILPLIGVAIGWLLSERGKIFADKRQDKRKLRKLLFFLLELRYHFAQELSIELEIDRYFDIMKNKMAEKLGIDKSNPEFILEIKDVKPILKRTLTKVKDQDDRFEYLSENIDKVIVDLAEVFPILAYELNGQHNIKDKLNKVSNYFSEIESMTEGIPFDISKWINPKMTKDLLLDLDESIEKIANRIDKRTLKISQDKIASMTTQEDDNGMGVFIDEYLKQLIDTQK